MRNPSRARSRFLPIFITAVLSVPSLAGCVDEDDDPERVDERSLEGAVVTHCGVKTVIDGDGTRREVPVSYYFEHMNNELDADLGLRTHVGLHDVSTCEEAERFALVAPDYHAAHPIDEAELIPKGEVRPGSEDEGFRIYYGEAVQKLGVVKITTEAGSSCTGTFITARHILTAAHCFESNGGGGAQEIDIKEEAGSTDYVATNRDAFVHIHPNFTASGTDPDDDMAIISLWNDLSWTPTPHRFYVGSTIVDTDLEIYGWGMYNDNNEFPGFLRTGDNYTAINLHSHNGGWFKALAHTARGCSGDSGGPAIEESGTWDITWGVYSVTESEPCPSEGQYMKWTKTNAKATWIADKLSENLDGDFSCTSHYIQGELGSYYKCFPPH